MEIRVDELRDPEIVELLEEHLRCMRRVSPPESVHALDVDGLRQPGVTFWSIWDGAELAECGALKELDAEHAELKSMRTAYAYQRKGVASRMLQHLIEEARGRGYRRLSLETGSTTQGESVPEALANLREATELYLEEFPMISAGQPLVTTFEVAGTRA